MEAGELVAALARGEDSPAGDAGALLVAEAALSIIMFVRGWSKG